MNRLLAGTSAAALTLGLPSQPSAAEWEVKIGGFFEQYAAFSSVDVDGFVGEEFDGVDNKGEGEVHFKPSLTLDNGLKIGADIQLEAAGGLGTPDTIDEAFVFVEGSFGRLLLGSENSAGYLMTFAAPDVTFVNVNSGSMTFFVPFSGTVTNFQNGANLTLNVGDDVFRRTLGTTFLENDGANDFQKFTYFTPRFSGFQLGVSYGRDGNQDSNAQLNLERTPLGNIFDVGANYVGAVAGVDVSASGRWGIATDDQARAPAGINSDAGDDPQIWSAGLNLGYSGVTIGGSFAEQNNAGLEDGRAWDAGISYETGPWGFSFTYINGRNVDDEGFVDLNGNGTYQEGIDGITGADEQLEQYLLGISYVLAKGVALNAFGAYVDFDEDVGDAGGPNALSGDDLDAIVVGTGIKISF